MSSLEQALREASGAVNAELDRLLPQGDGLESRVCEAMRYAVMAGGKRLRPFLVLESSRLFNVAERCALRVAAAIEMVHTYSLVHDDLPAMDDDDLRRGQPTCHRAFDEATAILAGDALQSRAFELLTGLEALEPATALRLIGCLATAAGPRGMVGGQALDLSAVDQPIDLDQLEAIHRLKTGAMIRAAVTMGAVFAGADERQTAALDHYAAAIGLAFQVQDDILDIEGSTEVLGKTQGADRAHNKPTYPALLGLDRARQLATSLHSQALEALAGFDGRARPLRGLADFIISRQY